MNPRGCLLLGLLWLLPLSGLGAPDLLIRNASLADAGAAGSTVDVLVRGGRILRVAPRITPPAGDFELLEAGGKILTPGLFAGLNALGLEEISQEAPTLDNVFAPPDTFGHNGLRPEFDVTTAYNPHSSLVPVTRIEGYTWTLLAAYPGASIIAGQGRAVLLDGGYDSFLGDPVLYLDLGSDTANLSGGSRAAQWMQLEQAMHELKSPGAYGDRGLLSPRGREALATFRRGGKVVFSVDRASDILRSLEFAERHGLQPVIAGGAEAWMVRERLAAAATPVLLDPLLNLPGSFDHLGARLDNAALLHAAGVSLAFAQTRDMESHNARRMRQLAGNAVAHGLPHAAAMAALTRNPARIFGLDEMLGSLEPGRRADLVLWTGDPLELDTLAVQVIVAGVPVAMESRQTKLRDRYLSRETSLPRAYLRP